MNTSGVFEQIGRAGGFLRSPQTNYSVQRGDPTLSPNLCQRLGLRGGETIDVEFSGAANGRAPSLDSGATISSINGLSPDQYLDTKPFDELTAIDPLSAVRFSTPGGPLTMRIIDLMTPIGLGQRGLIVAPPRTGKTILLQQMAAGVAANHPDVYMMVLLIDERPEEVTDMRRTVRGEVVFSSNDRDQASHVRIARLMTQKAKRMLECGRNVFILLDSLTRLGRTFNAQLRGTGRTMSGGIDAGALVEPKGIFGAARNVENGGSLTIVASALIETGSRMDDVIFNEFKGTGNMEIVLSKQLANRRIWPAIDLDQSGTRKEEKLLGPAALAVAHKIRRSIAGKDPERGMEMLLEAMKKYPDNDAFVKSFPEAAFR